MGVDEDSLTENDWRILAAFGRMMLSAQLLEYSIFELANLQSKSDRRLDVALRKVEGLLKQPAADQAKGLVRPPEELREELVEAISGRNKLVHSFLIEYRIKAAVDPGALTWGLELLAAAQGTFDSLSDELDTYAKTHFAELGMEDLSEEDLEAVRESLEAWSAEMGHPDQDEETAEDQP